MWRNGSKEFGHALKASKHGQNLNQLKANRVDFFSRLVNLSLKVVRFKINLKISHHFTMKSTRSVSDICDKQCEKQEHEKRTKLN